jgi:protein-disulfide isomerase
VTIGVYACLRCPFCSRLIPDIYDCIDSGCMQGQAKMIFKPFPVKSHDYSVEGGLAFVAAMEQNKGFEYLLKAYANFDSFSDDEDYFEYAREMELNMATFQQDYNEASTQETLVDCKREGLYVGVEATPALFINGRPYRSELNMTMIRDIVEEEIERIQ